MKLTGFILVMIFLSMGIGGCKKLPVPSASSVSSYTLSGYVNVPGKGIITNAGAISVDVQTNNPAVYAHLADGVADNTGHFSISYKQTYIAPSAYQAQIVLTSQVFIIDGIPVNKSEDRYYEESSSGLLAISLNPVTPLKPQDTLFVEHFAYPNEALVIDTIVSNYTGYYATFRQPKKPGGILIWGIGKTELIKRTNILSVFPIEGDPVTDSLTINY